ncbi:MAG: phosphopantothenoylcysteine decarboxylase [Planctomycetota bacterium]
MSTPLSILMTAGPTHEPIDAVRFLGNRSSGKLGSALAEQAANDGHRVTLLLGPTKAQPNENTNLTVIPFQSTADLQALLERHLKDADVLIMAAAVADYRPKQVLGPGEKLRRTQAGLSIELESTPDLLAACAQQRTKRSNTGQLLVGFALEPQERLLSSARAKLARKGVDAIVANPLETMDASTINATLVTQDHEAEAPREMSKHSFAIWLLEQLLQLYAAKQTSQTLPSC